MVAFIYIFLLAASILLQLTFIPFFSIHGATPNLILIMVIIVSIREGRTWGVISGFIVGFCFDFFGTGFVGVSSLANSVAAFSAGFLRTTQFEKRLVTLYSILMGTVVLHDVLYLTLQRLGSYTNYWSLLFLDVLPQSLYSLLFIAMIHLLFPGHILSERHNWRE